MKRLFNLIVILLIVVLAMAFGRLNSEPVTVDFFVHRVSDWPLGFWLLLSFLVGMIIAGTLVYVQLWFSLQRRLRAIRRESEKARPPSVSTDTPRLEAADD